MGTDGNWDNFDVARYKWAFLLKDGNRIKNQWANLRYTHNGITRTYAYHFNEDGVMDSGWYLDKNGKWYFLNILHDGWFGRMVTGWHLDQYDGHWYWLDLTSGVMATGWKYINEKWYYFNPSASAPTWKYEVITGQWVFMGNMERPLGSMYQDEMTPDGYRVDLNGAWVK